MSHFKAKIHQIRFPASVWLFVCPFVSWMEFDAYREWRWHSVRSCISVVELLTRGDTWRRFLGALAGALVYSNAIGSKATQTVTTRHQVRLGRLVLSLLQLLPVERQSWVTQSINKSIDVNFCRSRLVRYYELLYKPWALSMGEGDFRPPQLRDPRTDYRETLNI